MMAYSAKFVLCVLVDGVPQKELANGTVKLPFGTHYSLRLRNRNSRAAAVQIFIDGENVSGEGYKVPANDKVDIKRHADKDVTFKFVDLDSPDAVEHGKNGPNPDKVKGTIEARFFLEREKPKPTKVEHHHHHHHTYPTYPAPYPVFPIKPYPNAPYWCSLSDGGKADSDVDEFVKSHDVRRRSSTKSYCDIAKGGTVRDATKTCSLGDTLSKHYVKGFDSMSVPANAYSASIPNYDLREGTTVEGHASGQKFNQVYMDLETDYVSVKVFLKGYDPVSSPVQSVQSPLNEGQPVRQEVLPGLPADRSCGFCTNCGTAARKGDNFCGNCGKKLNA